MKIYDLKTNYQINPIGISLDGITFSWKTINREGQFQKCVRLVIGKDVKFDERVYDSGEQMLDSCTFSPEVQLNPGNLYYWKVWVTDERGNTGISETAVFEGGHPIGEWTGSWIQPPFVRELHPVFRKTFYLNERDYEYLTSARLYICGLGLYEAYINGHKVGDEYLTPYYTDYRYWIQYQTYDIWSYLKAGENRIDVYLGNGWYKGRFGYLDKSRLQEYYGDRFKLIADIYLYKFDGSFDVIGTDESWMTLKSPINVSGIYEGEMYDSRMEAMLENVPGRQIRYAIKAQRPQGKLSPMVGLGVRKREVLKVREIIYTRTEETVLDFGQEITGWVAFHPKGEEGRRIILQYGEVMQDGKFYRDNLRTADAVYTFVANGKKQFARPHFTFYGFRYVKVIGMEVNESNVDEFEAWALYSDMEETGRIRTSDEKINRLIENTKWSQKDNFLDIPTDCPQRDERLGWTGDAQIFSSAACYHMQTATFFRKYLKDMCLEQAEKGGAVPYVVPDVLTIARIMNCEKEFDMAENLWGEAGSSVWGDAATIIPWNLYRHYGNRRWLLEQYGNMKQWIDFIIHMDETYCGGKRLWTCGFHFGDWLSLDSMDGSTEGGTDKHFVASVYYMYSAELTAKAAEVLGKTEDAKYYRKIYGQVRNAIRSQYITGFGQLAIETQTAYVLGIWFGIFENKERQAAGDHLCMLLQINGGKLSTGFVGTGYLCQSLSATDHADVAYDLLFNEEYPGWLYEVNLGATTIWERWNSLMPDGMISSTGMNSLNHYAYGVIIEWVYECVCGLKLSEDTPGARRVLFMPQTDRRLSFAYAEYHSVAGDYRVGWERKKDSICYYLQVPFNCSALFIPEKKVTGAFVNGIWKDTVELSQEFYAGEYEIQVLNMVM